MSHPQNPLSKYLPSFEDQEDCSPHSNQYYHNLPVPPFPISHTDPLYLPLNIQSKNHQPPTDRLSSCYTIPSRSTECPSIQLSQAHKLIRDDLRRFINLRQQQIGNISKPSMSSEYFDWKNDDKRAEKYGFLCGRTREALSKPNSNAVSAGNNRVYYEYGMSVGQAARHRQLKQLKKLLKQCGGEIKKARKQTAALKQRIKTIKSPSRASKSKTHSIGLQKSASAAMLHTPVHPSICGFNYQNGSNNYEHTKQHTSASKKHRSPAPYLGFYDFQSIEEIDDYVKSISTTQREQVDTLIRPKAGSIRKNRLTSSQSLRLSKTIVENSQQRLNRYGLGQTKKTGKNIGSFVRKPKSSQEEDSLEKSTAKSIDYELRAIWGQIRSLKMNSQIYNKKKDVIWAKMG